MSEFFSHPFVLLLAGALLSSLVVPAITRRWQDHQKELELKTALVTEITETVTDLVMAVQFAELGTVSQTQEEFDAAYRKWEIESAVIGSKLRAYFPETDLGSQWRAYTRLVTDFYALAGVPPDDKADRARRLLEEVARSAVELDADAQAEKARYAAMDLDPYQRAWAELKAEVVSRKDVLARRVLAAETAL